MEAILTYEAAYNELKEIEAAITNETISVDELASKVKRAAFLVKFCQDKLRATEQEVNAIIRRDLNSPSTGDEGEDI
ncbi:exodeoxyribonuclease VII small subunit [Chitinophaga caeni]|uniref:Exodeoxyribonuclease VII small subunit n=1 Tax=Chitinophaga caeni TaxID=2029983 RepID=A0A291QPE9_9BACT|nr:exodeoxyribonuclease VII small subunit [Chitinophaga caeni]ATL45879.1 exodeoxyribonuclease VII small subunit [Chitinophaga caeni]